MTRPRSTLPLVAAAALVTGELVRSSGPLLDMAFAQGVVAAAVAALATYALPGLAAAVLVLAVRGPRVLAAAAAGALVLAAARAVLPLLGAGVRFGAGLVTVALGVAVLTLAVAASTAHHGAPATVRALVLGLLTNVGLQLALGTWDAVWRTDVAGWVVTVLLVVGLAVTALAARPGRTVDTGTSDAGTSDDAVPAVAASQGRPRLWALGPFLALAAMMLANPAFAASQGAVPLVVAGAVLAAALLLGAWLVRFTATLRRGAGATSTLVALLAATTAGAILRDGVLALASLALLAAAAPLALTAALAGRGAQAAAQAEQRAEAHPGRTAGVATVVGLGTILPLLVYQLDYDVPLGFPNGLVVVATGLALALATFGTTPAAHTAPPRASFPLMPVTATAVAAVVVGAAVLTTTSVAAHRASAAGADDRAAQDDVTVVVWNLHYGVSPAGHVALADVADAIDRTGACVVLLQEVSRGWVMGGGADMGTWLANRLGMRMSYAPAADHQFGNAVLSCAPQRDVVVHDLPYGDGPQDRSAVSATVELDAPQRYTSVHLQHRERNTPTRLAQLDVLLGAGDLGVLGGDLNSEPGWAELDAVLGAGFTSAQDAVGDPDQATSPSTDPRHRIDWVFVPDGVEPVSLEHLTDDLWSDHLALVLTHRGRG